MDVKRSRIDIIGGVSFLELPINQRSFMNAITTRDFYVLLRVGFFSIL